MREAAKSLKVYIALCLALCLSSCLYNSKVSDYAFHKANVCDDACWVNPEATHIYKVGKQYFAEALQGKARAHLVGWPGTDIFSSSRTSCEYEPDEDSPTFAGYVELDRFELADGYLQPKLNSPVWSSLPNGAKRVPLPEKAQISSNAHLQGKVYTDWHQLYLYPAGVVTWLVVDVPFTIIGNIVCYVILINQI